MMTFVPPTNCTGVNAMLCRLPAEIATTLLKPIGKLTWPTVLSPQPTRVPSFFNARLWSPPAETATTLLKPGGTVIWPSLFRPQAMTVPSFLIASAWYSPLATSTILLASRLAGILVTPETLPPQDCTLPLLFKTTPASSPPASIITFEMLFGTLVTFGKTLAP